MTELVLKPGNALACRLARHLSRRGARARSGLPADRSRRAPPPSRASSRKGEPVYGINTGFGKLASVRIEAADLATLQRNIVLSHAAGVGEPMPVAVARLMMALKLASLAQGASGVRPETLDLLEAMLAKDVIPVMPGQGLGRRVGRPRAARAYDRGDDRRRRSLHPRTSRMPAEAAFGAAGLEPVALGAKEGLALLNGTQFSTAYALAAPVRGRTRCSSRRWSPARCRPTRRRAPTRRSIRASTRCAAIAARSRRPPRCAR